MKKGDPRPVGLKSNLSGAPGWLSCLGVQLHLAVRGFKPCIGLCADSSEPPASDFVSPSLSTLPPLMLCLHLSKMNKH